MLEGQERRGDVSPISMSPISQSQFIPLGEVLCLAISAMNASRKRVTQEALMEHLATCFPGVPTPSQEILRHTLNMLVRERKIYPTPDGYFIVTPQTYFITPSLIRTNSKWYHLDERIPDRSQCTSPQPGSITPSTSGCVRDRAHHRNHCDSCNCFREEFHNHTSTLQKKSTKECKDSVCPPSFNLMPATHTEKSKSTVNCSYKTETLPKHKDGEKQSKKFGLKLFRLSFKKDKSKQLVNFSAQFPPEEWPLRDEDNPTSIPREVEQELIKRINPDLTVENVLKHTALMKKLEEDKAQRNKAGSSAQHSGKSKKSRSHKKSHGKSRSHSKSRVPKGEHSEDTHLDVPESREYEFYDPVTRSPCEKSATIELKGDNEFITHDKINMVESHFPVTPEWDVSGDLYKRRMESRFHEHSRESLQSKVHRSHSHTQDRKSRNDRSSKAKERSRSMDNSKRPLGAALLGTPEEMKGRGLEESHSTNEDSKLRSSKLLSYHRSGLPSHSNHITEPCIPECVDIDNSTPGPADPCNPLEHITVEEGLSKFSEPNCCATDPAAADYFQCNTSKEGILTASSPSTGCNDEHLFKGYENLTLSDGVKNLSPLDRFSKHSPIEENVNGQLEQLSLQQSHYPEKVDTNISLPGAGQASTLSLPNGEVFKPHSEILPGKYVENSYQESSGISLYESQHKNPSEVLHTNLENLECVGLTAGTQLMPVSQGQEEPVNQESSFDYYNVSDDESEDGTNKKQEEAKNREDGGTVQWLLEREKEKSLQRKFEKNLTLPKEGDNNTSQKTTHTARLDSMDSSSITVDSGFNSPRTRESLASNTSSLLESNRRQNPALSPGHGGTAAFSFRATTDSAPSEPENLQEPLKCLASVTSV
ncbi:storkhead-box protein 2 isoform X2 [Callorhinchus milii]|uniref:storkhead-box protein 2 isoform X2 n=1 Tax=Callorhinchus milii TaxID=7868 RepID=UPI00045761A7|nr:storkhead-box protein 2 isoform X2 [Callorhinchus milii]|eukprot:gi/632976935/ref/XP_007905067.1/ PREDICTED: storkhead-box protein 2 isoform X2 [Callorhinchus milii]